MVHFFEFSAEHNMLRKAVREFAETEVAPHAAEWDKKDICPTELFKKMGELGIIGVFVPKEYGGGGLGFVGRAICLEEISRYSAGLGIALMTHQLGIYLILQYGTEVHKKKHISDLCAGVKIASFAATEPSGGTLPAGRSGFDSVRSDVACSVDDHSRKHF